jgi:hypothetical protein
LDAQASLLDSELFHGARFPVEQNRRPQLLVNMSDLGQARSLGLSRNFVLLSNSTDRPYVFRRPDRAQFDDDYSLAALVAMSGAFPGAFPMREMRLKLKLTELERQNFFTLANALRRDPAELKAALSAAGDRFLVADGGIPDNLGLRQLINMSLMTHDTAIPESPPSARPCAFETLQSRDPDVQRCRFDLGFATDLTWNVDLAISSDASQMREFVKTASGLDAVARAINLASSSGRSPWLDLGPFNRCQMLWLTPAFSIRERQHKENPVPVTRFLPIQRASKALFGHLRDRGQLLLLARILPQGVVSLTQLESVAQDAWHRPQYEPSNSVPIGSPFPDHGFQASLPSLIDTSPDDAPAWDRSLNELAAWADSPACKAADWIETFENLPGSCAGISLAAAIEIDIENAQTAFRHTSTLTDEYSKSDAEAIYRLGQYTVALSWTHIEQSLTNACAAKGTCAARAKTNQK